MANDHHVEIGYGKSVESRYLHIDGHDLSMMVPRDSLTVQFTETGASVTLTLLPGYLDINLNGAEVQIADEPDEPDEKQP